MNVQDLIIIAALIATVALLVGLYYTTKYRKLTDKAMAMCRELIQIRRKLYNDSKEEANGYVIEVFTGIKSKNEK